MFTNPKPAGWTDGVDKITGAQIGSIATQLVSALDTAQGGSYAIATGETIAFQSGGGSWSFACNVAFTSTSTVAMAGPFNCAGAAAFATTVAVTGAVTCSSTLAVTGAATCSSTLAVTGATTLSSTLAVTGASTLTGAVSCVAALTVGAAFTCTGLATFNGQASFNGIHTCVNQAFFLDDVTFSGDKVTGSPTTTVDLSGVTKLTGRQVGAFPVYLSTANVTLDHATGGNEIIMLAAPASNIVITLRQGTAPLPENGDWFEITVLLGTSAFTVGIKREGSADYVAVIGDGIGGTGNQVATVRVKLVAGVWRLVSVGGRYVFSGSDS